MIRLHAVSGRTYDASPFVARVTRNPARPPVKRNREILVCLDQEGLKEPGFRGYLVEKFDKNLPRDVLELPPVLSYLGEGDVVKITPRKGDLFVLYRRKSGSNTLLLTERCNNACVMCCQPPKAVGNDRMGEVLETIELIDPATRELGLSGGEPSLYREELLRVVRKARNYLPGTAIHLLSNGREFRYLRFAQELAEIRHPDLMVGVPVNADIPDLHDFIVQRKGAFDETILGLMNLKRCGIRVEVRVVVHRLNVDRLVALSSFIGRNLAFCSHVAIMAMEVHGLALANLDRLWIDPADYRSTLRDAVLNLAWRGTNVSLFNYPLCVLGRELWQFARQSISDWKVEFLPVCCSCRVKNQCCGVFATSHGYHSRAMKPVLEDELPHAVG